MTRRIHYRYIVLEGIMIKMGKRGKDRPVSDGISCEVKSTRQINIPLPPISVQRIGLSVLPCALNLYPVDLNGLPYELKIPFSKHHQRIELRGYIKSLIFRANLLVGGCKVEEFAYTCQKVHLQIDASDRKSDHALLSSFPP